MEGRWGGESGGMDGCGLCVAATTSAQDGAPRPPESASTNGRTCASWSPQVPCHVPCPPWSPGSYTVSRVHPGPHVSCTVSSPVPTHPVPCPVSSPFPTHPVLCPVSALVPRVLCCVPVSRVSCRRRPEAGQGSGLKGQGRKPHWSPWRCRSPAGQRPPQCCVPAARRPRPHHGHCAGPGPARQ